MQGNIIRLRTKLVASRPSSGLSATFSHPRAREKALNGYCLLPFEEWEKVPDRADEGLLGGMTRLRNYLIPFDSSSGLGMEMML